MPEQYLSSELTINKDLKENFINDYIKNSPEFDQHLYDNREKKEIQHANDFENYSAALNHGKAILEERDRVPKCTYCGSTNIKKNWIAKSCYFNRIIGIRQQEGRKTVSL